MDGLEKILAEERAAEGALVMAPVAGGRKVRIRIRERVLECMLEKDYHGWGVFRYRGKGRIMLERDADPWEKKKYAQAFGILSLVLFHQDGSHTWWARDNKKGTYMAVHLVEDLQQFDPISACHDGVQCWFVCARPGADMRRSRLMRDGLSDEKGVKSLPIRNLTPGEQEAYTRALLLKEQLRDRDMEGFRRSVEKALQTGGGTLMKCTGQDRGFSILWQTREGRHLSTLVDRNLSVISAGLCLSGGDRLQDLTSLASLLSREPEIRYEEAGYY